MLKVTDKLYLTRKVRFIETHEGYTASVYTEWGWYDLSRYYCSKTQCRKALWYAIINL